MLFKKCFNIERSKGILEIVSLMKRRLPLKKSGVFLTKFGHKLLLSLSAQPDYV